MSLVIIQAVFAFLVAVCFSGLTVFALSGWADRAKRRREEDAEWWGEH